MAGAPAGAPAGVVAAFQLPGSNALDVASSVRATMEELKRHFPPGMDYEISLDTTAPDTGETLTISGVTQPANGTVTFSATEVRFTPAANFSGTTAFAYTVTDGNGGSATAAPIPLMAGSPARRSAASATTRRRMCGASAQGRTAPIVPSGTSR